MEAVTLSRPVAGILLPFGNAFTVTIEFAMARVRQFREIDVQGSTGLVTATDAFEEIDGKPEDPLDG